MARTVPEQSNPKIEEGVMKSPTILASTGFRATAAVRMMMHSGSRGVTGQVVERRKSPVSEAMRAFWVVGIEGDISVVVGGLE